MNDYKKTILKRAAKILKESLREYDVTMGSCSDAVMLCQAEIGTSENEKFGVLYLDSQNRLIEFKVMFEGTINAASVYPREIVKHALLVNAANVILTHNHPSGIVKPSNADKAITKRLRDALALLDISVLDHIIVSGSKSLSFAQIGEL